MATLEPYETKAGTRYLVRYRTPSNKQTMKRGFTTKRDARAFINTTETSKLRGEYIHPTAGQQTITELGTSRLTARKATLKPSMWRTEESAWRNHVQPRWGTRQVGTIRASEIREWVATMTAAGASATTVKRAHGILAGILADAVKDRMIAANPAAGLPLPRKVPAPRAYLTHTQVEALAQATLTPMHATIVRTLAYCGLRWGEFAGLRVKHVNFQRRRFMVEENAVANGGKIEVGTPKTHERRSIPFPRFLEPELKVLAAGKLPDMILFGDGEKYLLPSNSRDGWFVKAVRRCQAADASFPTITPHGLRHTAASLAVSAGANVKAVQRMLGHASAAMTLDTYSDLFDDDLDAVADALHEARSKTNVLKMCSGDD